VVVGKGSEAQQKKESKVARCNSTLADQVISPTLVPTLKMICYCASSRAVSVQCHVNHNSCELPQAGCSSPSRVGIKPRMFTQLSGVVIPTFPFVKSSDMKPYLGRLWQGGIMRRSPALT
jgi:hypothetical protein